MIPRAIQKDVERSLKSFPAVGLVGARQVGKTTLARMIEAGQPGALHLDLESPQDVARLADPELLLSRYEDRLVVIDEAQAMPQLFPVLRVLIDRNRHPGRFLILGSASPDLKRQASESLAGRIAYHELYPLTLAEVGQDADTMNRLWVRGGYPESYLASDDGLSFQWRESFIQTHLQRDMPALGVRVPATTLRRFWTMVAHCHAQTWNSARIGESMGIDHKTVRHYLDILCDTFMLRQLPPYFANVKKQLVKSPKVYIRCSGLLHSLLRIGDWDALQGHPILGESWEGFCVEQIAAVIPSHWGMSFYRTRSGAEIDLVIHPVAMEPPIVVEIKASTAPRLSSGNLAAIEDLSPSAAYVVYPGPQRYPIARNVEALPVSQVAAIAKSS
ncbi:MAG: ATP-binding protein [Phycisphaerae bacterium]